MTRPGAHFIRELGVIGPVFNLSLPESRNESHRPGRHLAKLTAVNQPLPASLAKDEVLETGDSGSGRKAVDFFPRCLLLP